MVGVLYSINRPHTDNIKSGLKLWEIRKSKPNIPVPFPAFIYETKKKGGCGKVIGEFICDEIITIKPFTEHYAFGFFSCLYDYDIDDDRILETCLTQEDLKDYGKGKPLYGLHISKLKIYDKPKELSEFRKLGKVYHDIRENEKGYLTFLDGYIEGEPLTCPPQSWCKVEKL